ncbi:hypothetical protein G7Y89_g14385 [Cudoniella acicularis]|uniref:Methyltransferase domain-containing protein n=1 Tax=Cudoniella acicularis TaxID=354080 RepID=A0A8H4VVZ8_9HELO|nr:hypothetical protein G7Y89_g14385 [Cudoniella acicularis]
MPPVSPHDSAISVATTSLSKSSTSSDDCHSNPKPHSPCSPTNLVPYSQLPPEQQAAQDLENDAAVQQAQDEIDIDSGLDSESDAGYETDSLASTSTSISSSVRDFTFENGRRYHKFREGAYNFPNDDSEQEREDMKHAMMVNLCQQLHFAPIGPNPQNILDMGTGTGVWAIEMGDLYPGSSVLGVDLSPIQPEWVPPNVKFMVDDVESPWLKPLNYYDYVHARHTVMAIKDWPKLMRRALEHLKPGGWFELQEIHHYPQCHDGSMPVDHLVAQYWSLVIEALSNLGVNFNATLLLADMMRDAGFTNITTRVFHVPIGVWPKNKILKMVGLYWRTILIDGLQPIALGPFYEGPGLESEHVLELEGGERHIPLGQVELRVVGELRRLVITTAFIAMFGEDPWKYAISALGAGGEWEVGSGKKQGRAGFGEGKGREMEASEAPRLLIEMGVSSEALAVELEIPTAKWLSLGSWSKPLPCNGSIIRKYSRNLVSVTAPKVKGRQTEATNGQIRSTEDFSLRDGLRENSPSTSSLVELAAIITRETEKVEKYIKESGSQVPSFEIDGPLDFPRLPEDIKTARLEVMRATKELGDLVTGPREGIRWMAWDHNNSLSLRAIYHYQIVNETATYAQIAEKVGLDKVNVRRFLRHAMTNRIFKEVSPDVVAHTAASRVLAEDGAMNDWVGFATNDLLSFLS